MMSDPQENVDAEHDPFAGTREALRQRHDDMDAFLEAVLVHAPFDGWTDHAIQRAIAESDVSRNDVRRMFPRGVADLLAHLDDWADQQMSDAVDAQELARLRVHERIHKLIMARFECLDPHREAMRRASTAGLMPQFGISALRRLWQTIDLIWVLAGDETRDINRYTKRGLLSAAYASTVLYWLDQRENSLEDTAEFLTKRLSQAMNAGKSTGKLMRAMSRFSPQRTPS